MFRCWELTLLFKGTVRLILSAPAYVKIAMRLFYNGTLESSIWLKNVDGIVEKCFILLFLPVFLVGKKCAIQFCREPKNGNKQFFLNKTLKFNSYLNQGSLEIHIQSLSTAGLMTCPFTVVGWTFIDWKAFIFNMFDN